MTYSAIRYSKESGDAIILGTDFRSIKAAKAYAGAADPARYTLYTVRTEDLWQHPCFGFKINPHP